MKEGRFVPRRGNVPKREVLADPLYNSVVVTKLINGIMYDGKKGVAQQIVYDAFAAVEEKTGKPALEVFQAALENIMPVLESRCVRNAGTRSASAGSSRSRAHAANVRWLSVWQRKSSMRPITWVTL